MKHAEAFFNYAVERYAISLLKEGNSPWPWTENPILQKYRFCNVFREQDTVTRWIKLNLRDPMWMADFPWHKILLVLTVARFINRVDTLARLADVLLKAGWNDRCYEILQDIRKSGQRVITGAYMIRTPHGMNKIKGLDGIFRHAQTKLSMYRMDLDEATTLQRVHEILTRIPYMGSFMAYEVVTDFRHTVPEAAEDHMTWAAAGPGATRGLSRVEFGELGHYRNAPSQQPAMLAGMQKLLELSQNPRYWPKDWPTWEMREVEHTLCEFDKHERVRLGEGEPKQRYTYDPHRI
jgi:hypothetical protein